MAADDRRDARELRGRETPGEQRQDVAGPPLLRRPAAVALALDRPEPRADPELVRAEEHVLQHRRGLGPARDADHDAERDLVVDHRLADVEDVDSVPRERLQQRVGDLGTVLPEHRDQNDVLRHVGSNRSGDPRACAASVPPIAGRGYNPPVPPAGHVEPDG